ncbi:MAG: DUF6468 domain-containing protein [Hyphomicrobiales bacterium]
MTPGLLIEGLVIVLLIATISYCVLLSGRLKRLKSEESALRSTIAELLTATELAERAIRGLKVTATEHQKTLGLRVRDGERVNVELHEKLEQGEELVKRLTAITNAGAPLPPMRRSTKRPTASNPRTVSEMAIQATERINAIRNGGA